MKALLAFLILPGIVAGLIPALIIMVDPWQGAGLVLGTALSTVGFLTLIQCVWDFYATGKGTLAHWQPPRKLVVVGLYQYVRNPMYIGVIFLVGGLALFFGSLLLLGYLILLAVSFHLHTVFREEPWLARQFGDDWKYYAQGVRRWLPRLRTRPSRSNDR